MMMSTTDVIGPPVGLAHPRPPHSLVDGPLSMTIPCTSSSMFPGMLKLDKSVYSSPPPAANTPENNICKLLEYRGHKVAAFSVDRRELICLPQAFELFLKHLVGGLHTVYTKLKRLGIVPVVCNVEQVRILRGLGAIQPGVNRCKLIGPKEFDVLYEDCTNSSARPGRPPKRSSPSPMKPDSDFRPKQSRIDGEIHGYSPYKWMDLMKTNSLFGNGYYYPPQMAAHLPFMPHPAMMNMAAMNGHLPPRPSAIMDAPKDLSSPVKDLSLERSKSEEFNREKNNNKHPLGPGFPHTDLIDKPLNLNTRDVDRNHSLDDSVASCSDHDELSDVDLDLSSPSPAQSDTDHMDDRHADRPHLQPTALTENDMLETSSQPDDTSAIPGSGSMVALLINVQGLLRMAIESAKHREQKYNAERAELRRDMVQERERREKMERHLDDTQKTIDILQKKLKRERKLLRRMQESIATSGHMTQSHMTQGHMTQSHMTHPSHMTPVFPNPTQTPISAAGDRPYSNGMEHSRHGNSSGQVYHRNESLQEEDDSEVPRNGAGGELLNGHSSPVQTDHQDSVGDD